MGNRTNRLGFSLNSGSSACSPFISANLCSDMGMILSSLDDEGSSSELTDELDDTELPAESDGDGAIGDTTTAVPIFPTRLLSGVFISDVARRLLSSIEITTSLNSSHIVLKVMVAIVKG